MSKAAQRMKERLEIEFLKSKTYTEINEMFNDLNRKLIGSEKQNTKLKERIKSVSSLKVLEDCSVAYNEEQRTVKARCKAYNQAIEDVKQLLTKTK